MLWEPQHCGLEWESGLLKKEASPPVSGVGLWETQLWGMASPRYSTLPQGLLLESGTQAERVVVMGGHERDAGGDGCQALACGLVETSAVTPRRPQQMIMGGGDAGARPRSPFAEETVGGSSTTQTHGDFHYFKIFSLPFVFLYM